VVDFEFASHDGDCLDNRQYPPHKYDSNLFRIIQWFAIGYILSLILIRAQKNEREQDSA
jgi:hypothetical protein